MINKKRIYFGTDGMRGKVGELPMTPEFIVKFGWALGRIINSGQNPIVLIGKDTRISGYLIESALESGLSAAGVNIKLLGPMPTPAVSYLTKETDADVGIVISASHNPYYDNGIKLFAGDGRKVTKDFEYDIEHQCLEHLSVVSHNQLGKATRMHDAAAMYEEYVVKVINADPKLFFGINCVMDCANGANYQIAPRLFERLGFNVKTLNISPNGLNINENCGALQVKELAQEVINSGADFGVAFDGDGDRVIFVDETGATLDGDYILYLIAKYKKEKQLLSGGVVGTVMSNLGLAQALKNMEIPFIRSAVGDRYVLELLEQQNWVLGGEPSGHIINKDQLETGDGIISALNFINAWRYFKVPLSSLRKEMQQYPQSIHNIPIPAAVNVNALLESSSIKKLIVKADQKLNNEGRLLIRKSGTEPCLRVMVEAHSQDKVDEVINDLSIDLSNELSLKA